MPTPEAAIEYLTTTKIGEKGQLTVPKRCREDLGLGIGAPFAVLRLGDALILLPELQRFEHLCEQVTATLTAAGVRPRTILETLPQVRNDSSIVTTGRQVQLQSSPPAVVAAAARNDQP